MILFRKLWDWAGDIGIWRDEAQRGMIETQLWCGAKSGWIGVLLRLDDNFL
jgi:hypothetical protein